MTYDEEKKVADIIVALTERIGALESELAHEASHRQKLQSALAYWMPGVTKEIEISTNGRCCDDALLLVGSEGAFEDKCWGNEVLVRAEAAEAEVKLIREAASELLNQAEHVCLGAHTPLDIKESARNLADPIAKVHTALASTGGEHNAE